MAETPTVQVSIIGVNPDQLQDLIETAVRNAVKEVMETKQESEVKHEWMGIKDLARYLPGRPSVPTLYGWVHDKKIPFHKSGKRLCFLKSEIDNWIKDKNA